MGCLVRQTAWRRHLLCETPLPTTTTTTPGYNCLPHFTSENCQASLLFLPSLSFSFSLSFSSPRPHIRFSSNTLTLSLLMEYEQTRALILPHVLDNKHLFLTVVLQQNFSNAEQNCLKLYTLTWLSQNINKLRPQFPSKVSNSFT